MPKRHFPKTKTEQLTVPESSRLGIEATNNDCTLPGILIFEQRSSYKRSTHRDSSDANGQLFATHHTSQTFQCVSTPTQNENHIKVSLLCYHHELGTQEVYTSNQSNGNAQPQANKSSFLPFLSWCKPR